MSASNAASPQAATNALSEKISLSDLRLEAIERRRQRASDIVKLRKRKLSELYYVNKSPFIPISDQKILETQRNLLDFIFQNDIVNGHKFDIATLPQQPLTRALSTSINIRQTPAQGRGTPLAKRQLSVGNTSPSLKRVSPPLQSQQLTPKSKNALPSTPQASTIKSTVRTPQMTSPSKLDVGPPTKMAKIESSSELEETQVPLKDEVPNNNENDITTTTTMKANNNDNSSNGDDKSIEQNDQAPRFQEVYEVPPIAEDYTPVPTLSSLIKAYAESKPLDLSEKELLQKKRELDIRDIDINKLSVSLMPGSLPSQIPESSPLAELYYLTQTCPLSKLIPTTHKTLTTETYESALLEGKLAVVYSRIEELKRQKKWSLRQPVKFNEPFIHHASHKTQWSHLLDEGKWMATDFREGRKFKLIQCMFISQAVSDYWTYGKVVCVNRAPIKHLGDEVAAVENAMDIDGKEEDAQDGETLKSMEVDGEKVEEKDEEEEKEEEEEAEEAEEEVEEQESEKEFELDNVSNSEEEPDSIDVSELLKRPDPVSEIPTFELPVYKKEDLPKDLQPFKLYIDKSELSTLNNNIIEALPTLDAFETDHEPKDLSIVPVSKLLVPIDEKENEWYNVILKENYFFKGSSYLTEKGLFGFSSTKRLTFIRPPIPPPLKYLDLRIPTIWLPEDDRHLIRYVAEFQFNWSIISAHLSARPTCGYFSNIERRTPWQCFERYIQLNDKFQFSDMRGGYTPQAQMWLEAAHKAQTTTKRRISPLGVGNESIQRGHKRLRWASMFEAMRKVLKKRENAPKTHNSPIKKEDKNISAPTPLDLAKLKYERDKAIQEAYLHQGVAGGVKRSGSQQLQLQLQLQLQTQGRSNSSANAQAQQLQRQLAAAAANVANGSTTNNINNKPTSPDMILLQQQLQIQLLLQRMQKQLSASSIATAANALGAAGASGRQGSPNARVNSAMIASRNANPALIQQGQAQASNVALQAQQQRLQLQQLQLLKLGGRSNSNPTTLTAPNGQPYTNEQFQQLMLLQRQRNLQLQLQQMQSAPTSALNSQAGTPLIGGGATLAGTGAQGDAMKKMSPQAGTASTSANGTPVKAFSTSFSNSQVTAIVQQIQTQHPHLNKQQVSRLAASYLHNLSTQQQQQQHRAISNEAAKAMKSAAASNLGSPVLQVPAQLLNGTTTPQRNLASSLQMLNSAQLTKLANSPTLTPLQRQQILSVQQQRLRNAGQAVLANNRVNGVNNNNAVNATNGIRTTPTTNRTASGPIPTPQQLASQRAKLQEQQQQQQQHHGDGGDAA